ncbi:MULTISPECIES: ParA family protein [Alteromonadaceae]|uniref:ParA family protein n=1 Tax=Brumicola blandensis TaxID=3075611 RepID=A0AAW8R3X8_9ALTE|nr:MULTISPECIES: ParA family protein [unclassified Alteromonas]MDT0582861.1 ParA family protein [Alteromonas sp. W409]MDT0628277.1 ParA family protein [Alteromonas sp. W364]
MNIWTVANQKGGVGKTTTAVTLGGLLAQQGHRVLLVDTDPHASLSYYFGIDSETLNTSIYDVFAQPVHYKGDALIAALCKTQVDGLHVLPATMALATLDRKMGMESGKGLILKKALHSIDADFDYVLIDCPPILGVSMVNALACSSRIIVPVQTEHLALKGLDRMMRTLKIMSKTMPSDVPVNIIATMFDRRVNATIQAYNRLKEDYPEYLWRGFVPVDTRFRDASQARMPASVFAPKCRGVFAYQKFLKDIAREG